MTTQDFKERFDENLHEIFFIQNFALTGKLGTVSKKHLEYKINSLKAANRMLDEEYMRYLMINEPEKHAQLIANQIIKK